jgi:AAA domain
VTAFYGQDYDDDGNPLPDPGPRVVSLADVEPEHVSWLWPGYLPLGKLVVLDGDPGVGKSTVTLDWAARVSTGSPMPDGSPGIKGTVLALSAEDGLADTIRPRLDAAGADSARVITITEIVVAGEDGGRHTRPVSIPGDLPAIEAIITEHDVRLVIVDVLMAYLSADVNAHRDQDVRLALHRLAAMAERCGCCVIVLRHLNKSPGGSAVYRGGGSIGIIGAARAGFMCGADPDDETGTRRVLAPVKCNLAAEPDALAYQLVPDELRGCARIRWLGRAEHTAATLLRDWADADNRAERTETATWLEDFLTKEGGEAQRQDIFKAGRAAGFSEAAIKRAKDKARITHRSAGFPRTTVWALPVGSPRAVSPQDEPTGPTEPTGDDLGKHAEPSGQSAQSAQSAQSLWSEPTEPTGWPEGTIGEAQQDIPASGGAAQKGTT